MKGKPATDPLAIALAERLGEERQRLYGVSRSVSELAQRALDYLVRHGLAGPCS